jgi:hypothetical protein
MEALDAFEQRNEHQLDVIMASTVCFIKETEDKIL